MKAEKNNRKRRKSIHAYAGIKSYDDLPSWAKGLYRQSMKNAGIRGIDFTLTKEEFCFVISTCGMRCAVSGLAFNLGPTSNNIRRPFFPSVDRRDSAVGYHLSNVRMVCSAVNIGMNQWGEEVFRLIAKATIDYGRTGETTGLHTVTNLNTFPGVCFKQHKKVGSQYGAMVRDWEKGCRYIVGYHGTPYEAFAHRLDVLRQMEDGTALEDICPDLKMQ